MIGMGIPNPAAIFLEGYFLPEPYNGVCFLHSLAQVLPLRYQLIICPDAKLHFSLLTIKKIMLVARVIWAIMRVILAIWEFVLR